MSLIRPTQIQNPGDATKFLDGTGAWSTPAGGGGGGLTNFAHDPIASYTVSPAPSGSYPEPDRDVSTTAVTAFASRGTTNLTDGWVGNGRDFGQGFDGFSNASPVIRLDLGTARTLSKVCVWGMFGSDLIYRPIAVLLERSDDDVTYTTVENRTGLTAGGQPGRRHWLFEIDASGSHQYWRVTLTQDTADQWTFVSEVEAWG